MVRNENDMLREKRENMRGGEGTVDIFHLEKEQLPESGRLFARLVLAPGTSIGVHEHVGETELFYFAQGTGIVTDDGVVAQVKAGDSMTTRSGHSHSVANNGDEPLVVIAVIIKEQ